MPNSEIESPTVLTRRFGCFPFNRFRYDQASGEWQRVLSNGNRRGPLLDPKPRAQRIRDELATRQGRRARLFAYLGASTALGTVLYALLEPLPKRVDGSWIGFVSRNSVIAIVGHAGRHLIALHDLVLGPFANPDAMLGWVLASTVAVIFALLYALYCTARGFLRALLETVLYAVGFQFVAGAKVLDPSPIMPGRELVERQKAHGAARNATAAESKGPQRSSIHSQEF